MYKDHLHDVKIIHMGPSTYSDAMVKEKGVARCANARANKVNGQYLTKARKLDTECFSSEPDVEAKPVLRKTQIVPESARSMRRRLRGVHLGHPSAATRGGEVRSHMLLAPSWGRFCGGGGRDLLG